MRTGIKRDIATSFTTLMFLVISISGVMMFFHFFDMQVKQLHEILGLVFVGTGLFHVLVNWKSMKNYFSKKIFLMAVIATVIVTSGFVLNSLNQGGNPKILVLQSVLNAPLKSSLNILNIKYDDGIKKLESNDIKIANSKTIREIAQTNKTSPFRVILIMTSK